MEDLKIGDLVCHFEIYSGNEVFTVVGIRENEVELYGDWSGGICGFAQKSWFKREGLIRVPKSPNKQWVSYKDSKPEVGVSVFAYSKSWLDEDFNPDGIREGFLDGDGAFTSAAWNNYQDCYSTSREDPELWVLRSILPNVNQ